MSVTVEVTAALDDATSRRVIDLCITAAHHDGVEPLSEHVRLHLQHGGDRHDRHLLASTDGVLAGYAHLDPTDSIAGSVAELVVHPAHRRLGVGEALLDATLLTAQHETGSSRMRLWAHGNHPGAQPLARRFGFTEGRRLELWQRDLDADLPEVDLPDDVRLRSFVPGQDERTWLTLNAKAFADHPEQGSWTMTDLKTRMAEDWFDPRGFLLAESREQPHTVLGFHWTKVHGAEDTSVPGHGHEPIGEVYVVGVDPAAQGRGLGRALTLAGLHSLRERGLGRAMLYVEGDNTAAQATYSGLGFRHWDTDVMFYRG